MNTKQRLRLGESLVQEGMITPEQLETALAEQQRSGVRLGSVIVDLGYLGESQILRAIARRLDVEFVDLSRYDLNVELARKLPEGLARRTRSILLADHERSLLVGMADPTDIFGYDEICRYLQRPVRQAIVSEQVLKRTFDRIYRRTEEIRNLARELGQDLSESDYDADQLTAGSGLGGDGDEASDVPVARLLKSIFEDAVQVGASDIHIEPDEQILRVRQRVDGVLQEQEMKEKNIASALVLRLKLMAGLDISEKRLPQDGRFSIRVRRRPIDVRLSTMPIQHGESVVMRLLDQSAGLLSMNQLGVPEELDARLRRIIHRPYGMVLVTGPTGSGKTTTLYAVLQELNEAARKIITVEDPVEYRLPRVNQIQVRNRIGLDFARILRSALRQDPDVMLIGEMRDTETVEIGLRAALTGHMVFSTLHTTDAITTVDRLLDMGAEGYLVAATLRAVVAQRLLRRICQSCAEDAVLSPQQQAWLATMGDEELQAAPFQEGPGCNHCNETGYRGRIGIYEMLELDGAMLSALRRNQSDEFHTAALNGPGYKPLVESALELAAMGVTSLAEAERVVGAVEEMHFEPLSAPAAEAEQADGQQP